MIRSLLVEAGAKSQRNLFLAHQNAHSTQPWNLSGQSLLGSIAELCQGELHSFMSQSIVVVNLHRYRRPHLQRDIPSCRRRKRPSKTYITEKKDLGRRRRFNPSRSPNGHPCHAQRTKTPFNCTKKIILVFEFCKNIIAHARVSIREQSRPSWGSKIKIGSATKIGHLRLSPRRSFHSTPRRKSLFRPQTKQVIISSSTTFRYLLLFLFNNKLLLLQQQHHGG